MDINRPQLEKSRSPNDITHIFNANFVYELPLGPGKRFLSTSGVAGKILGGWQIGGIMHWQSGEPVSFLSGRGTFNRTGRSENNTVATSLTIEDLKKGTGLFRLPDGRPVLFDPRFLDIGPDGSIRGANPDLFQNPEAGAVGIPGLTPVSGPQFFNFDFSLIKRTYFAETANFEFRAEFFNIFNHTNFNVSQSHNINSSNFGAITSTFAPRIIQFALKVNL